MSDVIRGAIKIDGLLEAQCFTSWEDFVKSLPNLLSVEVPVSVTNVTIGNLQPSEDERDHLWFRKDASGSFVGLYLYAQGAWRKIFPVDGEIVWVYGDSRVPPAGYTVIDTGDAYITAAVVTHLKQFYSETTVGGSTFYKYYAARYSGF